MDGASSLSADGTALLLLDLPPECLVLVLEHLTGHTRTLLRMNLVCHTFCSVPHTPMQTVHQRPVSLVSQALTRIAQRGGIDHLAQPDAWSTSLANTHQEVPVDVAAVASKMRAAAFLCASEERWGAAAELLMMSIRTAPEPSTEAIVAGVLHRSGYRAKPIGPPLPGAAGPLRPLHLHELYAFHAMSWLLGRGLARRWPWPLTLIALVGRCGAQNSANLIAVSHGLNAGLVQAQLFEDDATRLARKGSTLLDAAGRGDAAAVQAALEALRIARIDIGTRINQAYEHGVTPLMLACRATAPDAVQLLLGAGADASLATRSGCTALAVAAEEGSLPIVEALLAAGAPPDATDASGKSALINASLAGHAATVRRLAAARADVGRAYQDGWTALLRAAQANHLATVHALLEAGAQVMQRNDKGTTAIYIAGQEGHARVVDALLCAGADVDYRIPDGRSGLSQAAKNGHLETVRIFVERGASQEACRFALMFATRERHDEVSALLCATLNLFDQQPGQQA